MKKYSTKYTDWVIHFIVSFAIFGIGIYGLITSLNIETKFDGDLDMYLVPALNVFIIIIGIWLIIFMLSVVIIGTTGNIIFEKTELKILQKGIKKSYKFSELKSVEFVNRSTYTWRYASERGALWYSYCVMKFSNGKVVLTALNIENDEIARNMNINKNAVKNRERKIFELIG